VVAAILILAATVSALIGHCYSDHRSLVACGLFLLSGKYIPELDRVSVLRLCNATSPLSSIRCAENGSNCLGKIPRIVLESGRSVAYGFRRVVRNAASPPPFLSGSAQFPVYTPSALCSFHFLTDNPTCKSHMREQDRDSRKAGNTVAGESN